jgi:hypothetical protein
MFNFYELLIEHLIVFVFLLAVTIGFFYALFRKHFFSIFDPLFYYVLITEAFCFSDVVFMGLYGLIEKKYLLQYLFSEFALFAGILLFKPEKKQVLNEKVGEQGYLFHSLFLLSLILYVSLNIFIYATEGFPIFAENRFEIFRTGGGYGLISRSFDVLRIIIIYYLLDVIQQRSWRLSEWMTLLIVVTIQILSGAKSAVLTIVFIVSLYIFYSGVLRRGNIRLTKLFKRLILFSLGGFFIIAQVQIAEISISGRSLTVLDQAGLRLVNNGDAFLYAYPNNVIERLDSSNPIGALFGEYLAFLRIASPEELPMHIGSQLSKIYNGSDATTQTNAKHNIFGYVVFGAFGGVLYSFALGLCIGLVRYKLLGRDRRTYLVGIPYILLNLGVLSSINDWDNSSRSVLNVIFIFFPLVLISWLWKPTLRHRSAL